MKLNNKLMLLTAIFSTFSYVVQAQSLSAKDIYKYAKSRNYNALSQMSRYIDMQDGRGNTALCLAVIDDDYHTYNLLRQYGANPQPYCLQSAIAASGSSTFLGMGTTGWLTTGAIVAAGAGVAAAAGGGGGGGGSSDSSSSNNSSPSITCVNGSINNDECICNEGWTGETCSEVADCGTGYKPSCDANEYTTGETCHSGGNTLKKCLLHSEMPNCLVFSTTSDTCTTCNEGWTGATCNEAAVCGDSYKLSCGANEYTTGNTCPSGGNTLTECLVHSAMPNCQTPSSNSDTCEVCKTGYAGTTCTQAADGYTLFDEVAYPTLACANGSTQDKDHCTCGDG
ncbi:MAG: hypothetical protein VZR95_03650, partial [Alphaproteobacteria bacterium]